MRLHAPAIRLAASQDVEAIGVDPDFRRAADAYAADVRLPDIGGDVQALGIVDDHDGRVAGVALHHFAGLDAVVADDAVGRAVQHRPGELQFEGLHPRLGFLVPRLQNLQALLAQLRKTQLGARQAQRRAVLLDLCGGAVGVFSCTRIISGESPLG